MCNKSLSEGWLPISQRHAIITPIIKKTGLDANDVKSYRPISNLTYMSKLVERLVYRQLSTFLEAHNLIPQHQSGFRARHSTETAILKVMSDILGAADQGNVVLLGLLDMSAAFDTVDHEILLHRIQTSFGITGQALSLLRSFLESRTQQVSFNNSLSATMPVTTGVPQGSVLGPLLFLLYTADIPVIAEKHSLLRGWWAAVRLGQGGTCAKSRFQSYRLYWGDWRVDVIKSAQAKHRQNSIHLVGQPATTPEGQCERGSPWRRCRKFSNHSR